MADSLSGIERSLDGTGLPGSTQGRRGFDTTACRFRLAGCGAGVNEISPEARGVHNPSETRNEERRQHPAQRYLKPKAQAQKAWRIEPKNVDAANRCVSHPDERSPMKQRKTRRVCLVRHPVVTSTRLCSLGSQNSGSKTKSFWNSKNTGRER